MKHSRYGRMLGITLGIAMLIQAALRPAWAVLGGDVSSIQTDQQAMKSQLRVSPAAGYTVHEMQLPSGTIVKEYASASGRVFAVSWSGPAIPDLRQTLGQYFEQYNAAAAAQRGVRHHLSVQQPDFVAHAGGHMRAYHGQAYVPSLLPPNFAVSDIK